MVERAIQRLVPNSTGINFKFFAMLARMEYARRLLDGRQDIGLAGIALQAGYFDQAHFIHEFQPVYGEVPGAYRNRKGGAEAGLRTFRRAFGWIGS